MSSQVNSPRHERWPSTLLLAGASLYFLAALGFASLSMRFLQPIFDLAGEVSTDTDVQIVLTLTAAGLFAVPILSLVAVVVWIAKNYGSARWGPSGLILGEPFRRQERFLPWSEVKSLKESRHGIKVAASESLNGIPGAAWFALIPAPPKEQAKILQEVAAQVGQAVERVQFGRAPRPWQMGIMTLLAGALALLPFVLFSEAAELYWEAETKGTSAFLWTVLLGLTSASLPVVVFMASLTQIEFYPSTEDSILCLSGTPLFLSEIEEAGCEGLTLWVRQRTFTGKLKNHRARLRSLEELGELRELLLPFGVALAERVPLTQKRSLHLVLFAALTLMTSGLAFTPAIWVRTHPTWELTHLTDSFGQGGLCVRELGTGEIPYLILIPRDQGLRVRGVPGPAGARSSEEFGKEIGFEIDLEAGTWLDLRSQATGDLAPVMSAQLAGVGSELDLKALPSVDLRPLEPAIADGQGLLGLSWLLGKISGVPFASRQYTALPTFLETHLDLTTTPTPLGAFAAGRSSQRFYHLGGGPRDQEEWVAAVAFGRVLWVAVVPKGLSVQLSGAGMGFDLRGGPLTAAPEGVFRVRATGVIVPLSPTAPSLEALLTARARLKGDATTEETLEDLVPGLVKEH